MSAIVVGLLEILIAMWIWKKLSRRTAAHEEEDRLQRLKLEAQSQAKVITGMIQSKRTSSELDQLLLQDAMNREARAVAALRAVLESNGCTDEQIENVISTITEPEKNEK